VGLSEYEIVVDHEWMILGDMELGITGDGSEEVANKSRERKKSRGSWFRNLISRLR
jgi:sulfatase maturation enzyme AslB (radical SAM superfamily)